MKPFFSFGPPREPLLRPPTTHGYICGYRYDPPKAENCSQTKSSKFRVCSDKVCCLVLNKNTGLLWEGFHSFERVAGDTHLTRVALNRRTSKTCNVCHSPYCSRTKYRTFPAIPLVAALTTLGGLIGRLLRTHWTDYLLAPSYNIGPNQGFNESDHYFAEHCKPV